ncbi:MAG: hypothetical protein NC910_01205 [Candidatus Omnitrophica bacterium]|nr:hypothetical protein [Candidatus Omnitrophota bacterium]
MTKKFLVAVAVCVILYVAAAILLGPPGRPEHHFHHEQGYVTVLSALLLAMASGFAGASFLLEQNPTGRSRLFWSLAFLSFLYLSFDELLEFHERMGELILGSVVGPVPLFRNWNDVIVIGYGMMAFLTFLYFLPVIRAYPGFEKRIALAAGFYVLHTLIDSTQQRTSLSIILEESAKLFCSAFAASAMLFGMAACWREGRPPGEGRLQRSQGPG